MIELKIEIEGFDKVEQAIKEAPINAVAELKIAVQKSTEALANQTVKEAPVNKQTGGGNLRQNIRFGMTGFLEGTVESKAKYSSDVHDGTPPHVIRPKDKLALANRRTGQFFGKKVNHPGTQPNPFMQRAIEKVKPRVQAFFDKALTNIAEKFNRS